MAGAVDPRLVAHRPALHYDPQEAFRAISAASACDHPPNRLLAAAGTVLARSGAGLTLAFLSRYPAPLAPRPGDRLDLAPDAVAAARAFQADPRYSDRVYGRVVEDGGRTWLQYWLWSYDNPKNLLGMGRHQGDWELVQVGLGRDGKPAVATFSQHEGGEGRAWADVETLGEHPVVYVAPLSHANYYEPGAHPYILGIDHPDGSLPPVLARVEPFEAWVDWPGRWGSSAGVLGAITAGRLGGRSPGSPAHQGPRWDHPAAWHKAGTAVKLIRRLGALLRGLGTATYPRVREVSARLAPPVLQVAYRLDRAPLRPASRLLVTVHPAREPERVLLSTAVAIERREGTVAVPWTLDAAAPLIVRASAFNRARQRSDPVQGTVAA